MKTTKIVIAAITIVVLGALATGAVFAHYTTATPTDPYPGDHYRQYDGFWGWLGGCFTGYNDPYYPIQPNPTTEADTSSDATEQPQTPLPPQEPYRPRQDYYSPRYPNEGYYPRGYGRGCMGW